MTPISFRSPVLARSALAVQPQTPVRPLTVAADVFETAPAPRTATTSWSFRGGPDTEIGRAIEGMLNRARQSTVTIKGDTVESLFTRAILENRHVTNDQLLAMSQVTLDQLASNPATRAEVLRRIPDARSKPSHHFTVDLLSAVTGIDPAALSEASPDLGMTGAPGTPLLYAPKTGRMQRSTALHDFTDYLRGAGIKGLNRAVWGVENRILSAIVSATGGGRY